MVWCRQASSHYLSHFCQSSWRHMESPGLSELKFCKNVYYHWCEQYFVTRDHKKANLWKRGLHRNWKKKILKITFSLLRALRIHKAIGKFIASDLRPLSIVDRPSFKAMLKELDPRYETPGRTYFSTRVIPSLYDETKEKVRDYLSVAPLVSVTTDGWTSRATQSYVTITAHMIDDEWQLKNFVLQTRIMSESHTGANIASLLEDAMQDWKVNRDGSSIPIVTDNASNMVLAVKEAESLGPHIGCFAHVLNLMCQAALKLPNVSRLLGRVRRIVAFFHRSSTAAALLTEKQKLLQIPQHKLIMDVVTRWNSSYEMLERYLEQQAPVLAVLSQSEIRRNMKDINTLSDDDIHNMEELIIVLKPISVITKMLCDAGYPTISLVLPLKDRIISSLNHLPTDSRLVKDVKTTMASNLKERYAAEDLQLYLWQAASLDPRLKTLPTLSPEYRHQIYGSIVTLASSEKNKVG